ncbi:MAG TPA: SUMF1/EgtB/PvdO family nonheme iron enzyme [Polyangiaceae bacterium]
MVARARRGVAAAMYIGVVAAVACNGGAPSAGSAPADAGRLMCDCVGDRCACPAGQVCSVSDEGRFCVACEASGGACTPPDDAGRDAPVEAGPPVCTVGAQRCTGDELAVETCDAQGQWSAPWPCATGVCSGAACVGTTTTATSCGASGPGLDDCGDAHESCCTSVEVPGGLFDRAYAADGGGASGLAHPATVSGYRLDVYDVTVARFRAFTAIAGASSTLPIAAGAGKHAHLNGGAGIADSSKPGAFETGWAENYAQWVHPSDSNLECSFASPVAYTWTDPAAGDESLPIDCVTWYEAYAFCIWDGGFLPTETEWEYAAAAADQQREYPWGSTPPGGSSLFAVYAGDYDGGAGPASIFAPVGHARLGAGIWGHLDLAGEVWQWTLDELAPYVDPCHDCGYLGTIANHVYRGGGQSSPGNFVPSVRASNTGDSRLNIGIRCARTP